MNKKRTLYRKDNEEEPDHEGYDFSSSPDRESYVEIKMRIEIDSETFFDSYSEIGFDWKIDDIIKHEHSTSY